MPQSWIRVQGVYTNLATADTITSIPDGYRIEQGAKSTEIRVSSKDKDKAESQDAIMAIKTINIYLHYTTIECSHR
jgi:hypothetical protein